MSGLAVANAPSCNGGSWVVACGGCTDTYRNPFHCGNCGIVCQGGYCEAGQCR